MSVVHFMIYTVHPGIFKLTRPLGSVIFLKLPKAESVFLVRATSLYKLYSALLPACRVTNFSASDWSKLECYFLEEVIDVDDLDEENKTNKRRLSWALSHWDFYCPSLFDCSRLCSNL